MHDPMTTAPLHCSRVSKVSPALLVSLLLTLPARANDTRKTLAPSEAKLAVDTAQASSARTSQGAAHQEQTHRIESAQAHYTRGARAYAERRFAEAIEEFRLADDLAPRSALAFNVARAYEKLEDPARALEHYRDYLRRGADPNNRDEVQTRVRELEAMLATDGVQQVTVRSTPPGARVSIDGTERGLTPWTAELPLGIHQLLVTQGRAAHRRALNLDGKQTLDVELELSEMPRTNSSSVGAHGSLGPRTGAPANRETSKGNDLAPWPWLAFGAGGVALTAAGVFELLRRDAEADARDAVYQPQYYEERERMNAHQTTARLLLGASAVFIVTGGILTWLDAPSHRTEPSPVVVGCDPTVCMGTWMGSF